MGKVSRVFQKLKQTGDRVVRGSKTGASVSSQAPGSRHSGSNDSKSSDISTIQNPAHHQKNLTLSTFKNRVILKWLKEFITIIQQLHDSKMVILVKKIIQNQDLVAMYRLFVVEIDPKFHAHLQFVMLVTQLEDRKSSRRDAIKRQALDIYRRVLVLLDQNTTFSIPKAMKKNLDKTFAAKTYDSMDVGSNVFDEVQEHIIGEIASKSNFIEFFKTSFFDSYIMSRTFKDNSYLFGDVVGPECVDSVFDVSDPLIIVFLTAWELVPIPMLVIDAWNLEPIVCFANNEYCRSFGTSKREMIGKPFCDLQKSTDLILSACNHPQKVYNDENVLMKLLCIGESCREIGLVLYDTQTSKGLCQIIESTEYFRGNGMTGGLAIEKNYDEFLSLHPMLVSMFGNALLSDPVENLRHLFSQEVFCVAYSSFMETIQLEGSFKFWKECELYRSASFVSGSDRFKEAYKIFSTHLSSTAETPVSILLPRLMEYMEIFSSEENSNISPDLFADSQDYVLHSMAENCLPEFIKSSQFVQFIVGFTDVNHRSIASRALSACKSFPFSPSASNPFSCVFLSLLEIITVPALLVHSSGKNEEIIYSNDASARMLGLSRKYIAGKSLHIFLSHNELPLNWDLKRKLSIDFHGLSLRCDSGTMDVSALIRPLLIAPELEKVSMVLLYEKDEEAAEKRMYSLRKSITLLPYYINFTEDFRIYNPCETLKDSTILQHLVLLLVEERKYSLCQLLRYEVFRNALTVHLKTIYAEENIEFYNVICNFQAEYFRTQRDRVTKANEIYQKYISAESEFCVNVKHDAREPYVTLFSDHKALSEIDNQVFDMILDKIVLLMAQSCFKEFLESEQFLELLPDLISQHHYSPLVDIFAFTAPDAFFKQDTSPLLCVFLMIWELVIARVCILDLDSKASKILYANQGFEDISGMSNRELTGSSLSKVLGKNAVIQILDEYSKVREGDYIEFAVLEIGDSKGKFQCKALLRTFCVSPSLSRMGALLLFPMDTTDGKLAQFRKFLVSIDYFIPSQIDQESYKADLNESIKSFDSLIRFYSPSFFAELLHFDCFLSEFASFLTESSNQECLNFWMEICQFQKLQYDSHSSIKKRATGIFKDYLYPSRDHKDLLSAERVQHYMTLFEEESNHNFNFFNGLKNELEKILLLHFSELIGNKKRWRSIFSSLCSVNHDSPATRAHVFSVRTLLDRSCGEWLNMLLTILELLPLETCLVDTDSSKKTFMYISPPFASMMGFRRSSAVGKPLSAFLPLEGNESIYSIDGTRQVVEIVNATGHVIEGAAKEYQMICKSFNLIEQSLRITLLLVLSPQEEEDTKNLIVSSLEEAKLPILGITPKKLNALAFHESNSNPSSPKSVQSI